jgi:hypothetical protein
MVTRENTECRPTLSRDTESKGDLYGGARSAPIEGQDHHWVLSVGFYRGQHRHSVSDQGKHRPGLHWVMDLSTLSTQAHLSEQPWGGMQ